MAKQLREFSKQSLHRKSAETANDAGVDDDLEEEFRDILSSIIDEEYIMSVTGIKELSKVEYVSLQLDTKHQALYDLSEILPNLKHLVLDNSQIGSIRDLGTGLRLITSLSLSGCNLRDLDGIGVLVGLQELCLTDNMLADISPLTMHENLENLNITNNKISDLTFGAVLSSCPKLRSLFLSRNPIEKLSKYRDVVAYLLPSLEMLDGSPLDKPVTTSKKSSSTIVFASSDFSSTLMEEAHEELTVIREEMEEELRLDDNIFEDGSKRPAEKAYTTNNNDSSPRPNNGVIDSLPDTGSDLTHGSAVVLAGNMAAAMRRRRVVGESDSPCVHDDSETALHVLDNALRAKTPTTRSSNDKLSFMAEGDITEIVLGSPQRRPQVSMSPAAKQLKSKKDLNSNALSLSFDREAAAAAGSSRRPKSAFSSASSARVGDSIDSHYGVAQVRTPDRSDGRAMSPRQRNSSRPQSATVSPSEISSLFNDRNLPFVVSREDTFNTHGREVDDDSDEEERPQRKDFVTRRKDSPPQKVQSKGGSLVHQNIVRRFKSENKTDKSPTSLLKKPLPSIGDDFHISDDSDEDEELAVNHSDRLRFMIGKKDEKLSSLNKSRQTTLKKLQGQLRDVLDEDEVKGNVSPLASKSTQVASTEKSTNLEKKLGFNLAGSLAAIDKWVQDVGSDEDESEVEDNRQRNITTTMIVEPPQSNHELPVNRSSYLARPPSGKEKILSRDAIFHLCWNASEKRPDSRSGSRPSSSGGGRKSSHGSINSEQSSELNSESEYPPSRSASKNINYKIADYVESVGETTPKSIPKSIPSKVPIKTPLPKSQEMVAVNMTDNELIELLRKPPKTVVMLRTKANFQEFFRGIDMDHFRRLLSDAYADIPDPKDRESKIARRLSLMENA